jgi:outer membrane protein TolC
MSAGSGDVPERRSSLREVEAVQAEVTHYRDTIALLRARLYRNGVASTPRLEELQRRLAGAQRRLAAARAALPTPPA